MSLNSIFQFLVPKDKVFYPLFEQSANKLKHLSEILNEAVNRPNREELLREVDVLKSEIDEITYNAKMALNKHFITPFDREDIHALMSEMNNVADDLNSAAGRMRLYHIDKITKPLKKLTEANMEACAEVSKGVLALNKMSNLGLIAECCKNIYRIERKADKIFDKSVSDIFENETNALDIIKYKEVILALETATDSCKRVGHILETITIKYA